MAVREKGTGSSVTWASIARVAATSCEPVKSSTTRVGVWALSTWSGVVPPAFPRATTVAR